VVPIKSSTAERRCYTAASTQPPDRLHMHTSAQPVLPGAIIIYQRQFNTGVNNELCAVTQSTTAIVCIGSAALLLQRECSRHISRLCARPVSPAHARPTGSMTSGTRGGRGVRRSTLDPSSSYFLSVNFFHRQVSMSRVICRR
jgi:hypothetical protein